MRAQTLLFTTLLRALVVCIFLLLVLLDVSRSLWIDLAGLTFTGTLLLAVIVLALRRHRPSRGGRPPDAPTHASAAATPSPRGARGTGGEDPTPSPTPPPPPR